MMPVFVRKWNFLNKPLDFRKNLFGERIFGSHKTWRGLVFGVLGGIVAVEIQRFLGRFAFFNALNILDYHTVPVIFFGALLGFGVLFGDAVGSFVKRRIGITPGKSFMPFDQIVAPLGAMLFILPYYIVSWQFFVAALAVSFFAHLIIKYIGYLLKFERRKF